MPRRDSDISTTLAISASLVVHAGLVFFTVQQRVRDLTAELHSPPLIAGTTPTPLPGAIDEPPDAPGLAPDASILDPSDPALEPPPAPRPQLPPPEPERPKPAQAAGEEEWGEPNGQGIAVTSAPGREKLKAREGKQDQSFASRDPEGPGPIPDEPSQSLVPPGTGGDGRRPAPAADALTLVPPLPGAGAAADAASAANAANPPSPAPPLIGRPGDAPDIPPPPKLQRPIPGALAAADTTPSPAGNPTSQLPGEPERPAVEPVPTSADTAGPGATAPDARGVQLIPIARRTLIAIADPRHVPWPTVAEALTRPPGLLPTEGQPQALPEVAPADDPPGPDVRDAIASVLPRAPTAEQIADLVRPRPPRPGPEIVEALLTPPAALSARGVPQPLFELAPAAVDAAPPIQDAIVALDAPPPVEEMAQVLHDRTGDGAVALAPAPNPDQPVPQPPAPSPDTAAPDTKPAAQPARPAAAMPSDPAVGGIPGPPVPAADAAADTGLESDPFATIPSVEFRNGRVEARTGRVVKPVRPRLSDTGRRDLLGLQFPTVLAMVKIDDTGKVTDVKILRGSGSEAVDMPVFRALWLWWFEPPRDKAGKARPDVQLVAIHWS